MKLYLIDDNAESVYELINTVCCRLWKKMDDLDLTVIFFGDDYKDVPTAKNVTDADIEKIKNDISQKFRELCFSIDREEWKELGSTYKNKNKNTQISCQHISIESDDISAEIAAWKLIPKTDSADNEEESPVSEKNSLSETLSEKFSIQPKSVIALDICLLSSDYERCSANLPVISQAICNYLENENECTCFLYSKMSVNTNAKNNWLDFYKKQYNSKKPQEIHSLFNLCAGNSSDYRDLETLLYRKEQIE